MSLKVKVILKCSTCNLHVVYSFKADCELTGATEGPAGVATAWLDLVADNDYNKLYVEISLFNSRNQRTIAIVSIDLPAKLFLPYPEQFVPLVSASAFSLQAFLVFFVQQSFELLATQTLQQLFMWGHLPLLNTNISNLDEEG